MIDDVRIDCDEDGFRLVLTGDLMESIARYLASDDRCDLTLRLPQDAAIALDSAVRKTVGPWVEEMEYHRDAYARATPAERAEVLHGPTATISVDEILELDRDHPGWAERVLEAGDLARKAERESR